MSICFKIFISYDRYNGQIGAFEIFRLNETKPSMSFLCKNKPYRAWLLHDLNVPLEAPLSYLLSPLDYDITNGRLTTKVSAFTFCETFLLFLILKIEEFCKALKGPPIWVTFETFNELPHFLFVETLRLTVDIPHQKTTINKHTLFYFY